MPRRDTNPNFIEAIARGVDVIRAFGSRSQAMSLSELANETGLARPTVSRILVTLESIGYVRAVKGAYSLTPRVLELGMSYVQSTGVWELAAPHMERLVAETHESSSIAQLDGSDTVYVARVAVPKIISIAVSIGTRFPAYATALGQVLLSSLPEDELIATLDIPTRSGIIPRWQPSFEELSDTLAEIRARGWSLTDEHLAGGVRAIAVPIRDGKGLVRAALNVAAHAAETSLEVLIEEHLPRLLATASAISADWARRDSLPIKVVSSSSPRD